MKTWIKAAVVALMLGAAPVWAHGGHGGWRDDHRPGHGYRHWAHGHHKHHRYHHHRHEVRRVEHVYHVEPYPVPYPAVAPGVHISFPDLFIPWR